jgi:hypothetical protein
MGIVDDDADDDDDANEEENNDDKGRMEIKGMPVLVLGLRLMMPMILMRIWGRAFLR